MSRLFILESFIDEQINEKCYKSEDKRHFTDIGIGDYFFLKTKKGVCKFCKVNSLDLESHEKVMKYEEKYTFNPIRVGNFIALKLFFLNKKMFIYPVRPIVNKAAYEIKTVDDSAMNIILDEHQFATYVSNDSNYRRIMIYDSQNEVLQDSKDVQIYKENGDFRLFGNDEFLDRNDITDKFSNDNYVQSRNARQAKGKLYKLINSGRKEITIKDCPFYAFYDLFISSNNNTDVYDGQIEDSSNDDINSDSHINDDMSLDVEHNVSSIYDYSGIDLKGENVIVYGIPGCGKSWHVQTELLKGINKEFIVRTTFHPDYSNTDFIGQLRPFKEEGKGIDYKVVPGPFSKALSIALKNKDKKVALVIEEINRGNASAIFGDIFQLLDRNDYGDSEYDIENVIIEDYLNKEYKIKANKIKIPRNLFIYATMNTSDQNVQKLDTAFKRRWSFIRLTNKTNKSDDVKKNCIFKIDGSCIDDWLKFVNSVNTIIIEHKDELNGDRQLGYWFFKKPKDNETKKAIEEFANKVLEYLYNDVLKYAEKSILFKSSYDNKSFDDIYDDFLSGKNVFNDRIDGVSEKTNNNEAVITNNETAQNEDDVDENN